VFKVIRTFILASIIINLSQKQVQTINNVIQTVVTTTLKKFNLQAESFDSSESSRSEESQEKNDNVDYNDNSFQSRNIDLFNSNLKTEAIKIKNNKQIYHNVFSFTNQL